MSVDTHKMVEGKQATEARTAWLIEIGPLRFRCLRSKESPALYEVQTRVRGGWSRIGNGTSAEELLRRTVQATPVVRAIHRLDGEAA